MGFSTASLEGLIVRYKLNMVKILIVVTFSCLFIAGCASSVSVERDCGVGQANLDNVCVSQRVADYVSCVRSPNSTYDIGTVNSLGGEIGKLAVSVKGVSEFKEEIKKKYYSSENVASKIIEGCSALLHIGKEINKRTDSSSKNFETKNCSLRVKTEVPGSSISVYPIPNDAVNAKLKVMDGDIVAIAQSHNEGTTHWNKIVVTNGIVGWIKRKYVWDECI